MLIANGHWLAVGSKLNGTSPLYLPDGKNWSHWLSDWTAPRHYYWDLFNLFMLYRFWIDSPIFVSFISFFAINLTSRCTSTLLSILNQAYQFVQQPAPCLSLDPTTKDPYSFIAPVPAFHGKRLMHGLAWIVKKSIDRKKTYFQCCLLSA